MRLSFRRNLKRAAVGFFVDSLIRVNDVGSAPERIGEFPTREEAFAASRRSIDEFLSREFKPGMSAKNLYDRFRDYAAVPFIFGDNDENSNLLNFNPIKYALERCEEICGNALTQV
jgi:hypothetical protein